jgi:hypothetical protein
VTIFGALAMNNVQLTAVSAATADPTVVILRNTDPAAGVGQGSIIKLSIARSGPPWPIITRWDKTTHATTSTTCTSGTTLGGSWGTWALVIDQTSWTIYVDAGLAGSGSCNLVASWSGIDVGGEADQFYHGRTFPATHAHIAVFGRKLTAGEIRRLSETTSFGYFLSSSETVATRIQKKLAYASWRNPRVLTPGTANLTAEASPSGSVSDFAAEMAGDEDSQWFVDAANQVQYRNRVTGYQQFPRAVLGEDVAGGEIPYQVGQLFDFNPTFIYNDIEIENTTDGGYTSLASSTVVAVDDTSAARYGARTMARPTRFLNTYVAWNVAWWWLARYAYPQIRVGTIVVSAAATADNARWAFVEGVEVGDLVTVKRRPIGQPAITVQCRVLRVQPSFNRQNNPVVAQVTLTLGAAPPQVPIANDPTYGIVGGTVLGA